MLSNSSRTFSVNSMQMVDLEGDHQMQESLVAEIKIKNKPSKSILIADIYDQHSIDQEIRWFLSTNNLKDQAFDFIKQIIVKKMQEKKKSKMMKKKIMTESDQPCTTSNKQNVPQTPSNQERDRLSMTLPDWKTPSNNAPNPHHIQIRLNSFAATSQATYPRNNEQSFAFNSLFTLPSTIADKERSQFTQHYLEQVYDTSGRTTSNFSTINELLPNQRKSNPINPRLTIKKFPQMGLREMDINSNKLSLKLKDQKKSKNPVKITLNRRNKQTHSPSQRYSSLSRRKVIPTSQRKNAIITPKSNRKKSMYKKDEFLIYDAQNLQSLVLSQKISMKERSKTQSGCFDCIPDYLQQDLKALFDKMTRNNPDTMTNLDSQYVSYQELTKEELLLMGVLFQKMDHSQLNQLDFSQFKFNAAKYCWKQLQQLHNVKVQSRSKIRWSCPNQNSFLA